MMCMPCSVCKKVQHNKKFVKHSWHLHRVITQTSSIAWDKKHAERQSKLSLKFVMHTNSSGILQQYRQGFANPWHLNPHSIGGGMQNLKFPKPRPEWNVQSRVWKMPS